MDGLGPLAFLAVVVALWVIGRGIDRLLRRRGLGEGCRLLVVCAVLLFVVLAAVLVFGSS